MNTYSYDAPYPELSADTTDSASSWSSDAGDHLDASPSYSSLHTLDLALAASPTFLHDEHFGVEDIKPHIHYDDHSPHIASPQFVNNPFKSTSPYAPQSPLVATSPYTDNAQYALSPYAVSSSLSSSDSPFLSAEHSPFLAAEHSPFLLNQPLASQRNMYSPPPLALEPLADNWDSGHAESYVNISDLIASRPSSPIDMLTKAEPTYSPLHYDYNETSHSGKRKRLAASSSLPLSLSQHDLYTFDDSASFTDTSSYRDDDYEDDDAYDPSSDNDSVYVPRPGRSRGRKRSRVSYDYQLPFADGLGGIKSRGRKVPVVGPLEDSEQGIAAGMVAIPFGVKQAGPPGKDSRRYVCTFDGCGKCFVRGEHLKRHVRSLHLREKPHQCTVSGCSKSFSRKDNLKQHMSVFH